MVGGERDVVGVDDGVGTDVAHVTRGVEWREVGALLLLLLLKVYTEMHTVQRSEKWLVRGWVKFVPALA